MSFHWCDNLHTAVFSPRDYQIELLAAAYERNTMVCLGHKSSREFIALKLLQELGRPPRGKSLGISVYLSNNKTPAISTMLQHLTDLRVYQQQISNLSELPLDYEVYIIQPNVCLSLLRDGALRMENIHILIVEDCHQNEVHSDVLNIFKEFYCTDNRKRKMPKVLGLAGPLHSAGCILSELSAMLNALERSIHSKTETASDIVTVLRYCAKPMEYIVQCSPYAQDELCFVLRDIVQTRQAFLNEHRYDPFEIYSTDEFLEELKDIPDPKKEPLEFLNIILNVLQEMGPWCADRVALNMYQRIEKQKIKTPHERHYILLCLVNTALLELHAVCEQHFRKFKSFHKNLVHHYSTPKVLRLLEILRLFKPEDCVSKHARIRKINAELDQVDFQKLTRLLETKCHFVEQTIEKQQLQSRSIIENLDNIIKSDVDISKNPMTLNTNAITDVSQKEAKTKSSGNLNRTNRPHNSCHQQHRTKRRPSGYRRHHRDFNDSVDNLCAIIFCNSNYTARVLFDLLAEMSRHDPDLKFLKCQFTTDRVVDPTTEPKEAEAEHRRQEEVLKRFRMHDCNVLIGTSILEEGIDVPKCNLVIRWDPPTTYRSYVQCKGRARAVPAYHVILVASHSADASAIAHKSEQLNDRSHCLLCDVTDNQECLLTDSDASAEDEDEHSDGHSSSAVTKQNFTYESGKGTVKILNPEVITNKPPISSPNSDLVLKEINDDTPTLEDVAVITSENTKNEMKENNIDVDVALISENEHYKIYDLNSSYNLTRITAEETVAKPKADIATRPRIEKKTKYFRCLLALNHTSNQTDIKMDDERKLKIMESNTKEIVKQIAHYREMEKMLLANCANAEPPHSEHAAADAFNNCIAPYKPLAHLLTGASVDLSNAIALVNKYCAKLPSDTFTKLTPLWRCGRTTRNSITMYQCTLRLPINSPLKFDIVGLPMPSKVLARRMAALQACIELHQRGEIDDHLQPIGKESFKAIESDWENFELEEQDEKIVQENYEPRPGTTKRRQYYYKRIASEFCDCRPMVGSPCYLYLLDLTLQCPIPEEQNTRGRKIYPPEDATQGFGILTSKRIPKVSSFPIFTRSGEVKVSLDLHPDRVMLSERQITSINTFINYTFTKVLRLKKFLMLFDPESTENCVFIVPTIKNKNSISGKVIDWSFLELIERNANMMPTAVPEDVRHASAFDADKFKDAVVMPWYRNQDQPHYFYVAEICHQLSPLSIFPSKKYLTFKHYYHLKYGLNIHANQPLLDVDHTSARLNFLTPRYVNRKGVALPTSSEATKRAKRENLELKQILVPELCTVHPFPASLWRTAVCMPCILYRINGLLLADDIRKQVAADIGLGQAELPKDKEWPMLHFGWSLSDVLKKSMIRKSSITSDDACQIQAQGTTDECDEISKSGEGGSGLNAETKTVNEIVADAELKLQKEGGGSFVEIGTWSNDMAVNVRDNNSDTDSDYDDDLLNGLMSSTIKFCGKSAKVTSPTFTEICLNEGDDLGGKLHKNRELFYDSDASFTESSFASDDGFEAGDDSYEDDIEFTSKNEAETIETEEDIEKFNKQISIIQATKENDRDYQKTKNLHVGYDFTNIRDEISSELNASKAQFEQSTSRFIEEIETSGILVPHNKPIQLPPRDAANESKNFKFHHVSLNTLKAMLPHVEESDLLQLAPKGEYNIQVPTVEMLKGLNLKWWKEHPNELFVIDGCGDIFDSFNDAKTLAFSENGNKIVRLDFSNGGKEYPLKSQKEPDDVTIQAPATNKETAGFSFDHQPHLSTHPGPSPSIILQALTMSNANDGINLERLETIGDSFLKYAITTYLYITYENVHEGKLSHLRSKQVANLNLYRLGRHKQLGEYMIATKFEPSDNWLPPCYYVPKELEKALIEAKIPPQYWSLVDLVNIKKLSNAEICELVRKKADEWGLSLANEQDDSEEQEKLSTFHELREDDSKATSTEFSYFIPYNLVSQHSIPDKSIADCVEALIGAYLIECGLRGALLFMAWLGIRVLPYERVPYNPESPRIPGSTIPDNENMVTVYGSWSPPKSPLLRFAPNAEESLEDLLIGYDEFENVLGYKFRDKSYLLQAMTHASYTPNRLTDCYQRLEFLGDAVLDYLITRHLYEDSRQHSPGALTDLRSALVNNTIFASLAVRHGFHKYFRHLSPALNDVIDRFVRIQTENGHSISEEYYLLSEEECDDAEDVEVPKALGDVFESVAGAIFLDSCMSLDEVWRVYSNMMGPEIEQFSNSVPKSPIRELLELEPETAKFGKPEKLADGRRVRVTVEVFCKGTYRGIGRNYRIAKCTAAKCALRQLKKKGFISKKI